MSAAHVSNSYVCVLGEVRRRAVSTTDLHAGRQTRATESERVSFTRCSTGITMSPMAQSIVEHCGAVLSTCSNPAAQTIRETQPAVTVAIES